MKKQEIAKLFNRIKNHYNTFTTGDEKVEEWYKFLKDYDSADVNKAFDEYMTFGYDNAPLVYSLTKNIIKIKQEKDNSWITCCDICGERITIYDDDMEDYEKHFRKCSKIDFIDRMNKKYKNREIDKSKFYGMSEQDLDTAYHRTLDYYLNHRANEIKIGKKMPD